MTSRKALLGLAAATLLLSGCATPYYGPHYAYGESSYNERPVPDTTVPPPTYSTPPTYYAPPVYSYPAPAPYYPYYAYPYYGPSLSFGFVYGSRGYGHRH